MKILFLSPWYPYPSVNGSKIRIYNLLKSLSRIHEITLLSFVRSAELVDPSGLDGICRSIETVPWIEFDPRRLKALVGFLYSRPRSIIDTYSLQMESRVSSLIQKIQPELVICSQFGTSVYAPVRGQFPVIFEEIELSVYWDSFQNTIHFIKRFRNYLTWLKMRRYVSRLLESFAACTVVSKNELDLLASIAPHYKNFYLIPNGVDVDEFVFSDSPPIPNTLIYTGALTYHANYDAVQFFLSHIFPRVLNKIPDVEFFITGPTDGVDLSALNLSDHVTFTGYLPDIRPVIQKSWASVAPLRYGGGTRLKILEAMALGTPVISTSKGAQGLGVTPGEDILIADQPEQFADFVVELLKNPDLHRKLSVNGRKLVETQYSWDKIGDTFEKIIETVYIECKSRS